jgi:hypothetical protein
MKEFLRKIKLVDWLTTELHISKNEFINNLNAIIDQGDTGLFTFEMLSSGENELVGRIDYYGFKIRRRRRFFDTNMNFAIAKGTFEEQNGALKIETEINGFSGFFIPYYLFLIIICTILFWGISTSSNDFFLSFILFFFALLMLGIPYLIMRRSVKRLKYELEREFYYLTKR